MIHEKNFNFNTHYFYSASLRCGSAGVQESAMRIKFRQLNFSLLLLFSLALFASSSGLAQEDQQAKTQKQTEKRQELERKTLAMLDEVATQALSLKLPENRSFVLTSAADL